MSLEPELPVAASTTFADALHDTDSRRTTLRGDELIVADAVEKDSEIQAMGAEISDSDETANDAADLQITHFGRHGKIVLWIGIALMWTVFELDHTTVYNYQNYAASDFGQISSLGALQTAGTIIVAVMKPPIAKISDVAGRVETYCGVVVLYVVSYILCATSPTFDQYAGGFVIYSIGQTGMQILNQIIVADITTSRWRGLANGLINLPFMIVPWCSAFIVQSVLENIGWRWGVGMFAIIMPITSLGIIVPLLIFRRRSRKEGCQIRRPTSAKAFFSAIDLGGITLLAAGSAMFLLPLALAGNTAGGWKNPWIPTVTAVGILFLISFGVYEVKYASKPVMPARYFRNLSLVLACSIGLLDAFAFQVTHTYMYAWATVSHNFSARNATFLTYTAGCFQVLAGLITGYLMYRTRRYKWLLIIGVIVRLIGYGIMLRLRGSNNPVSELFIVQAIQGLGSGNVGAVVIVVAQIVVNRAELAQATALILLSIFMGQAIGSAVAGGIYTNTFRKLLRKYLGSGVPASTINSVFDSIDTGLPPVGSTQRDAINAAYTDVLKYMTIAALVASALPFLFAWFLPNFQLNDEHNLSAEVEKKSQKGEKESESSNENRTQVTG